MSADSGRPLAGASVHLLLQGQTKGLEARTDAHGQYRFASISPGTYTLAAELTGYGKASFGPFVLTAKTPRNIRLTLRPAAASQNSSRSLNFYDKPQFTIAGVTDASSLGGHGSNVSAPAKDDLARQVVSLGGAASVPAGTSSPASEQSLRQAAERQPASFDANRRLGKLLLDQNQPTDALPYLQRASRLNPADYQTSYELALAYARAGRYDLARTTAQILLSTKDRPELHHLLGEVAEKSGNPLEAARQYERAAKLDPSESNLFDWGAELLLHRAAEPAVEVFSNGNRLFPNSARMLMGLGVAWFVRGSYDRAARYICQASDLDPDDRQPYLFLGKIQSVDAAPSPDIAGKLLRFVRLHPRDPQANYYYALSLWKAHERSGKPGDLSQVKSLLQKAVQLDPGFGAAYLQLGMVYSAEKQYPAAISFFHKAISASPRLPDAHYQLAQAYMRSGEKAKARAELQLYDQLTQDNAQQAERDRRHMQQFVYTLRSQTSASQPR